MTRWVGGSLIRVSAISSSTVHGVPRESILSSVGHVLIATVPPRVWASRAMTPSHHSANRPGRPTEKKITLSSTPLVDEYHLLKPRRVVEAGDRARVSGTRPPNTGFVCLGSERESFYNSNR